MTEEKLHEVANYLYRVMVSFDYSSLSEFTINLSFKHDTFWIDTDVKNHEAIRFKDVESEEE